MSTVSLRLPTSLHEKVREVSEQENISMDQFIAAAVAEKLAAFLSVEYLEERARRGSREKFEAVLAKVPDVEPEEYDRL
jgi:hypothetical protein